MRFGIGKSVFNYFDHAEVFARLAERSPSDRLRFVVERQENGAGTLLAVSNPTKAVVRHDDLRELLDRYDGDRVTYHNGVVESHHSPRVGHRFHVSGDAFANRFVVRTPVDGFGQPSIYLSLLREVCSNGMIGEAPAFRSQLALGRGDDEVTYTLSRALDGFNNDEGYAALRQRFESAAESWASVHEAAGLYNILAKLTGGGGERPGGGPRNFGTDGAGAGGSFGPSDLSTRLLKRFHETTGDVTRLYGLANADALSAKRQKTLPVNCKVYDLLNFATEIATHHAGPANARRLHAWAGGLVSGGVRPRGHRRPVRRLPGLLRGRGRGDRRGADGLTERIDIDPALLHLPPSRRDGPDRTKYLRHLSKHGASLAGMPPLEVVRGRGGRLRINSGVTRAYRAAKLCPGRTVPADVIATDPNLDVAREKTIAELP